MFKSSVFAVVLLTCAAIPVAAQDIATRILNIENRLRDLTGQMEELNFSLKQLQKQLGNTQQGTAEGQVTLKKLSETATAEQGVEEIQDVASLPQKPAKRAIISGADGEIQTIDLAPGPTNLGSGQNNAAGGGGQVIVPEGEQTIAAAKPSINNAVKNSTSGDAIETVALTPANDSPEALYEKNYEVLLRRQFGEAEAGFRQFLQKYPDHSLAGSAQYQLGETFYAQGNYQEAARNFLLGYKNYPKSRRAPDSLLKLGLSLRKLDQRDQACAALQSVSTEFPRAVEAKKRATAELKRAGC